MAKKKMTIQELAETIVEKVEGHREFCGTPDGFSADDLLVVHDVNSYDFIEDEIRRYLDLDAFTQAEWWEVVPYQLYEEVLQSEGIWGLHDTGWPEIMRLDAEKFVGELRSWIDTIEKRLRKKPLFMDAEEGSVFTTSSRRTKRTELESLLRIFLDDEKENEAEYQEEKLRQAVREEIERIGPNRALHALKAVKDKNGS